MATYNERYARDVGVGRDIGDIGRDVNRRPSAPKWLWPVLAIVALVLLGLLFSRGMRSPTREIPAPRMDNEPSYNPNTQPMREPMQPQPRQGYPTP